MDGTVKPRKIMSTLGELWDGKRCPQEKLCACRQSRWCPEAKNKPVKKGSEYPMTYLAGCSFAYKCCCCRVLEEIEILAGEYLDRNGIMEPPVPLELLNLFDSRRPIEIQYLPLKRYLGCTWFIDNEWVVQLNRDAPADLRLFTAFHEGFHVICGSSGLAFKRSGLGCQQVGERLADYFAASILMPKELVIRTWYEVHDTGKIAGIFGVPESIMKEWLSRLRLHSPSSPIN